jgi:hypothetical protein
LRVAGDGGESQEVVESENAEAPRPFEHDVQQIGRGQRVVQGPVGGPAGESEVLGQRPQLAVADLVPDQAAGEGARVDDPVGARQAFVPGSHQGGVEEGQVEPDVVAHQHGAGGELQERREHGGDGRRREHHGGGDARQDGDGGRDRPSRVHEGGVGPEALAAPHLDRSDLGDGALGGRPPRRLEVDDAERNVHEGRPEVVERSLTGEHGWHGIEHTFDAQGAGPTPTIAPWVATAVRRAGT